MNKENYQDCRFLIQEREKTPILSNNLRGQESEAAVYNALIALPSVSGIGLCAQRTPCFDMIIRLNGQKYQIKEVKVQVKSSKKGVRKYWRAIQKRNGIKPQERNDFLKNARIILLLGTKRVSSIQGNFLKQLTDINNYFQKPKKRNK